MIGKYHTSLWNTQASLLATSYSHSTVLYLGDSFVISLTDYHCVLVKRIDLIPNLKYLFTTPWAWVMRVLYNVSMNHAFSFI